MIEQSFINEKARINTGLFLPGGKRKVALSKFPGKETEQSTASFHIRVDSVRIIDPLHNRANDEYTGTLAFKRYLQVFQEMDTIDAVPFEMEVSFYALRTIKDFGGDSLMVWGLYLGDIR